MTTFTIPRRRLIIVLAVLSGALILLHFGVNYARFGLGHDRLWGLVDRLNIDAEESFSQFLQMLHLIAITGLLWLIGLRAKRSAQPHAKGWLGMAIIFAYLTLDESSRIHEMLIFPLQRATGAGGLLYFSWLVVAIPLVIVFVIVYIPFLRDLDPWTRRRFLLAGGLYVSGTIGMEMLGGLWVERHTFNAPYYFVLVPIEEIFEIAGQLLFLSTLLTYVARTDPSASFIVDDERDEMLPLISQPNQRSG